MATDFIYTLHSFCGLHLTEDGSPVKNGESGDMENLRVTQTGELALREGYTTRNRRTGAVRALWSGTLAGRTLHLAVIGQSLFSSQDAFATLTEVGAVCGEGRVCCLEFQGRVYLLTGESILCFDGTSLSPIEGYRPLVRIGTNTDGTGGTPFEDYNLLTCAVRESYSVAEEGQQEFFLSEAPVASVDYVKVNGITVDPVNVYPETATGRIHLDTGRVHVPAGENTVEIGYHTLAGDRTLIHSCRFGVPYGGANDSRVFLYGNPTSPAVRYYSGIVNGRPCMEYFPAANFTLVGDGAPITSIVRHYDRQIIFTPSATYYSYPESATDGAGMAYTSFPVYTLSALRGNICEGMGLLVDNKPLSLMPSGLYLWNNTAIRDERNATLISERISPALLHSDLLRARIFLRSATQEVYLLLPERLYVYHYGLNLFYAYSNLGQTEMLEDEKNRFFFGTEDGRICQVGGVSDDGEPIEAHWESGVLDAKDSAHTKNLYSVTVLLGEDDESPLALALRADNSALPHCDSHTLRIKESGLLDFSALDFRALNLATAAQSRMRRWRTHVKRFSHLRLRLIHPKRDGALRIRKIILRGTVNDQPT